MDQQHPMTDPLRVAVLLDDWHGVDAELKRLDGILVEYERVLRFVAAGDHDPETPCRRCEAVQALARGSA